MSKKILAAQARATFANVSKALTDLITAVPESHHAVLNGAIASVNTSIAGLEKVTDEDEAGALIALNAFEAMTKQLLEVVAQLKAGFAAEAAALPGRITAALNARVTAGEFVAPDQVATAVKAARAQGRADHQAELAKIDARKTTLATNGIPSCDAALAGTDEEFTQRITVVKPRVEQFKAIKGLDLADAPVLRALFAAEEIYQQDHAFYQKTLKAAPAAGGGKPNPLAGKSGGDSSKPILVGV